jgi:hypothetical protein
MQKYIEKMKTEAQELDARIKRAEKAIENPPYNAGAKSIELLKSQLKYMKGYSEVLHERINYEVGK